MPMVEINEVGLRDGLQNQPRPVSTADKIELARRLVAAGITRLEATSFVSPRAVPQMADAADVLAGLPAAASVDVQVLIPNLKGYERARAAGAREMALVLAATDTFNRRNINMGLAAARAVCRDVLDHAAADGIRVRVYIACACACPFDGDTPVATVIGLAAELFEAGAASLSIADTIGAGSPARITALVEPLASAHGAERLNLHVHDTRGQAVAMVWAGYLAGVRSFDASIGGLGGCPFAPGATGNAATEDIVYLFERSGIETGIDHAALEPAVAWAEQITGQTLGGNSMRWLRSQRRRHATAP